jgi:hypothetical protein
LKDGVVEGGGYYEFYRENKSTRIRIRKAFMSPPSMKEYNEANVSNNHDNQNRVPT